MEYHFRPKYEKQLTVGTAASDMLWNINEYCSSIHVTAVTMQMYPRIIDFDLINYFIIQINCDTLYHYLHIYYFIYNTNKYRCDRRCIIGSDKLCTILVQSLYNLGKLILVSLANANLTWLYCVHTCHVFLMHMLFLSVRLKMLS